MKDTFIYTSVNTRELGVSLKNLESWKNYSLVKGVRLVQNKQECTKILEYVGRLDDRFTLIDTSSLEGHCKSSSNPKDLPSLKELLMCMRDESLGKDSDTVYVYLNSDIVVTDESLFEELGKGEDSIALVHRKDMEMVREELVERGFYMHGIDVFCIRQSMLRQITFGSSNMFYLGLPGWDQYLPLLCKQNGWASRFIESDVAIHEIHDTSNPGSYLLFANRLVVIYICEYYLGIKAGWTRRILKITSRIKSYGWTTSIAHKCVVFPALRAFGWKISRKSNRRTHS